MKKINPNATYIIDVTKLYEQNKDLDDIIFDETNDVIYSQR